VVHSRAKLTPFGRLLLVDRVATLDWTVAAASEALGVSSATGHKWIRRYRQEGLPGLNDRTSRPRRCPRRLSASDERRILRNRRRLRSGPHSLGPRLGYPRSTVYKVLRRHGVSRLRDLDRPSGVPVRYTRDHPGELLHLDVKKLARIPDGGGHRIHGRERGRAGRPEGWGYDYLHVAVDDNSRVAYVGVGSDERGPTAARFLLEAAMFFNSHGVRIQRVLTDRALTYTRSNDFADAVASLPARHLTTRPYRPQTNGKAERFIQTMLREWAYSRLYTSNDERLHRLNRWLQFYNQRRPHTALGGKPPMAALLNNVCGNYS
jgi:transposase InsO family protein